jgi:hypothetical protein
MAVSFKTNIFVKPPVEELTHLLLFTYLKVLVLAKDWVLGLGPDSNLLINFVDNFRTQFQKHSF